MNVCKKCGLSFYGAIGDNYCGDCRKANGVKDAEKVSGENHEPKKAGFWRRFFGSKKQG